MFDPAAILIAFYGVFIIAFMKGRFGGGFAILAADAASGIITMVAHSGGPALALYFLRLCFPKAIYAGTTSLFFMMGKLIKAGPWLLIGGTGRELWQLMFILSPAVPLGVWAGDSVCTIDWIDVRCI